MKSMNMSAGTCQTNDTTEYSGLDDRDTFISRSYGEILRHHKLMRDALYKWQQERYFKSIRIFKHG